ncbi:MAG: hypothetical protein ACRDZO_14360 [Egibacteraceae bacterium]
MIIKLVPASQAGDCDAAAQALEAVVHTWDKELVVSCREVKELSAEERKAIDPLSVAALILSIPSAALAFVDLADRMRKRQRAQQIIEKAGEFRASRNAQAYIITVQGAIPLDTMRPDDLLDVAPLSRPESR